MATVESYNMGVTPIEAWLVGEKIHPSLLQFATGFFYRDESQPHNWKAYLVTNRHVVIDEKRHYYPNFLRIKIHDYINVFRSVREVEIPLYDDDMSPLWFEHSHMKDVDIIAMSISDYLRAGDTIQYWSKDDFPSQSQILAFGSKITILGYPL